MNSLPEQFNFAEHLFALNRARGDRIAYIDDQGTLSYSALQDRARRLAAVLANAGVRREERVLLLMLDTSDWPVAFLGCLYAGVVPVAVNTLLKPDDYAYMLTHCRAQRPVQRQQAAGEQQTAANGIDHRLFHNEGNPA